MNQHPIALITGASSGIGEATAHRLAQAGYHLIITARRKERIHYLSTILMDRYPIKVLPLTFDIRDREMVESALLSLPEPWKEIDILINNAGLAAGLAPIPEGNIAHWEQMIDTNIKGLLYVTRLVSAQMKRRRQGHIVNISSIAGKEAYANGNVYCATKHAVEAIGKSLRLELLPYGIKVSQVCPGAVETEFSVVRFDGDKKRAKEVYDGFSPLSAMDVAETIHFVVSRPAHVCINDILVMPTAQANSSFTHRDTQNTEADE